jgi:thiol-disulfide isomerase/thioredoxin
MRRLLAGVTAAVLACGLAACGSDSSSIAAQARSGDQKNFLSGDGSIERLAPGDRGPALDLAGTTLAGSRWSVAAARGKVVVLNVWGSWCAPCVAETPDLQKAWAAYSASGKPVQFMGINYRDPSPQTALAFLRANKVTYPSLADDGGRTILALRGKAANTPTTLVLDTKGRLAARVAGQVSRATLDGLVADVLGEGA